jgi:hypothetical protein
MKYYAKHNWLVTFELRINPFKASVNITPARAQNITANDGEEKAVHGSVPF